MSISSVDFSLGRKRKKSMKKFNIFDPLGMGSDQSREDNNDGDPHLVVTDTDTKVDALVPCEYCDRTFSADRIKRHVEERTWKQCLLNTETIT